MDVQTNFTCNVTRERTIFMIRRCILLLITVSYVLLIACTGIHYKNVIQRDTFKAYREFLAKNPRYKKVNDIRVRLENALFRDAKEINTINLYKLYLKEYPDGKYRMIAIDSIESLVYKETINKNNVNSFRLYLDQFPNGKYRNAALAEIEKLTFVRTIKEGTRIAYNAYLREYPYGKYADSINFKLCELAWEEICTTKVYHNYVNFMSEYKDILEKSNLIKKRYEHIPSHPLGNYGAGIYFERLAGGIYVKDGARFRWWPSRIGEGGTHSSDIMCVDVYHYGALIFPGCKHDTFTIEGNGWIKQYFPRTNKMLIEDKSHDFSDVNILQILEDGAGSVTTYFPNGKIKDRSILNNNRQIADEYIDGIRIKSQKNEKIKGQLVANNLGTFHGTNIILNGRNARKWIYTIHFREKNGAPVYITGGNIKIITNSSVYTTDITWSVKRRIKKKLIGYGKGYHSGTLYSYYNNGIAIFNNSTIQIELYYFNSIGENESVITRGILL